MKKHYIGIFVLLFLLANSSFAQYSLVGNTVLTGPGTYRLTNDLGSQVGSIWNTSKINLNESFDFTFYLYFGTKDADGADGITFTLQPIDTSIGVPGNGLGILGVTPALTVEYDTYLNPGFDPSYDHIALEKNGDVDHSTSNTLAGPVSATPFSTNIENGKFHKSRIIWDAKYHKLKVYFDCSLRLSYTGDIVNTVFGGNPLVYWGCTAATGGLSNEQTVKDFSIDLNKLKDTTICAGDTIQLNSRAGDTYSWSPATNISSTNIANPKIYPKVNTQYIVKVTDACIGTWYDTINVNIINPVGGFLGKDTTLCGGNTLVLDATKPGADYLWNDNSTDPTLAISSSGSYFVKVAVAGGCSISDTINVNMSSPPTIPLADTTAICIGQSATLDAGAGAGNTYVWTGPAGFSSSVNSVTVSTAGTYTVKVTNSIGCSTTNNVDLIVNALPTITLGNQVVCNGAGATFDAGNAGSTFSWTGPNGFSSVTNPITVSDTGTYSVTVTDANSCSNSAGATLSANNSSIVNLGSDTTYCNSINVTLDAQYPGATYLWNDNSTSSTLVVSVSGSYFVEVSIPGGCSAYDTININLSTSPTVSLADTNVCTGQSATFNAGGNTNSYLWSGPAGFSSSSNSVTVSTAGTYTVNVTNIYGCDTTANVDLNVNPLPTLTLNNQNVCNGAGATFDAGNAGATFSWTGPNGFSSVTNPITVSDTGTYSVTVTDTNSCSKSASATLSTSNSSIVYLGEDTTYCNTINTTLDAQYPGATYLWNDNSTSSTLIVSDSGSYFVQVSVPGGCSALDTINIKLSASPTIPLAANENVCAGQSKTLDAGVGIGNTYAWTGPAGFSSSVNSISVSTAGIYTVKVTNNDGCSTTSNVDLKVNSLPIINLSNQSVCNGASATFDAGNTGATFNWTGPNGYSSNTNPITVSDAGTYSVIVTDANSCSNSASADLIINNTSTFNLGNDTTYCDSINITLDAQHPGATYLWNDNSSLQTLKVTDSGTYSVTVDNGGCISTGSITIKLYSQLLANIVGDSLICDGSSGVLKAEYNKPINYLYWSNKKNTDSITINKVGNYSIEVIDTDGCKATDNFIVTQRDLPYISLVSDTTVCFMDRGKLTLTLSHSSNSYIWSNGVTDNQIEITSPGLYSVTAIDQYQCSDSAFIQVEEHCENSFFVPNTFTPNNDGINDVFKVSAENIIDYELQIFNRWGELIFDTKNVTEGWNGTIKNNTCQIDTYPYLISYATISKGIKSLHRVIGSVNLLR